MNNGLGEKIVNLLLFTRKATATEAGAFGLRERFLFCIRDRAQPPRELMDALGMTKSNLALLANKCISEGLIHKSKLSSDRRALSYSITEKGKALIDSLLDEIDAKFATVLTDEKERDAAKEDLDKVAELLSYL